MERKKTVVRTKRNCQNEIEQKQASMFVVTKQKSTAFSFVVSRRPNPKGQNFCLQKSCKTSFLLPFKKLTPENSTLFYKKHDWASTQTDDEPKKKTWAEKKNSFGPNQRRTCATLGKTLCFLKTKS